MKKLIAMLLAMAMLLGVCCAAAESTDGAEPYGDGDGVISAEQLAGLYQWLHLMNSETWKMVSFDAVCGAAGAQGRLLERSRDDYAGADWTDGSKDVTVTFHDNNGFWCVSSIVTTLSADVYEAADISGFPHVGNRDAGSSPVEPKTMETKVKPSGAVIAVTADVPSEYWYTKVSFGEARFLNCKDETRVSSNPAGIRLAFFDTAEDLAAEREKAENVQELDAALQVLGQEMKGYTYTEYGMNMTEYEGQLADNLWVAVRIYDMIVWPGTEAEAILNSLTWEIR